MDLFMDIEEKIFETGREILESAVKKMPAVGSPDHINKALFRACMEDDALKRQLFRFIDLFPSLKTKNDIARHFNEYMVSNHLDARFRSIGGKGMALAGIAGKMSPAILASSISMFVEHMAKSFITGETIDESIKKIDEFVNNAGHTGFTLDILGEKTTSEADADRYMESYLKGLERLIDRYGDQASVSIKLSSLYSRFDPVDPEGAHTAVRQRLLPIMLMANDAGASVTIDMESYHTRELTTGIIKEMLLLPELSNYNRAGIAVQAYLKDSKEFLEQLIDWARNNNRLLKIRLVKGAYWDYEVMNAAKNNWQVPVYEMKSRTDQNFEELTSLLLQNSRYTPAAIATHNIRSIAHALVMKKELNVPDDHFEIQMLYGTAKEIQAVLTDNAVRVSIYTTTGRFIPGMAYFGRRLSENSANESFLNSFNPEADPHTLLAAPHLFTEETEFEPDVDVISEPDDMLPGDAQETAGFVNGPLVDFSKKECRDAMHAAINELLDHPVDYGLYIDGRWINKNDVIVSFNPSTLLAAGTVSRGGEADLKHAVDAARRAFETWQYTTVDERVEIAATVSGLMRERFFSLAALISVEVGKTWKEATADLNEALDFIDYYSLAMQELDGCSSRQTQQVPGESNTTGYVPKGVVAIISPWNFPLAILTGMALAAIVSGNTVVIKPSSDAPLIAGELVSLLGELLPPGVLNFVPSFGHDAGRHLVGSSRIDMVAFTGSREVGLDIYSRIASNSSAGTSTIKTAVLEMGGKNGIIIDSTADIDQAIPGILASSFGYQGQKCSACSRLILLDSIYDEVSRKLLESATSLHIGPAMHPGTDVGPVINRAAFERIAKTIHDAEEKGAKIILRGSMTEHPGYFISPYIIEASPDSTIAREEVFGPVLTLIKASGFSEALEILNSTDYALTAGLYSRTPSNISRFKKEARVGNRYINRETTGAVVERQPFGGFKMSGAGSKAGCKNYLMEFMYQVTNSENSARSSYISGIDEYMNN